MIYTLKNYQREAVDALKALIELGFKFKTKRYEEVSGSDYGSVVAICRNIGQEKGEDEHYGVG